MAVGTDAELTIEQYITDHQGQVPTFHPGDRFSFTVNLQCSSTETGTCLAAKLVDELPEPLAFDDSPMSITPNIAAASVSGRTLTAKFNGDGFEAGVLATVTINVLVPTSASGDFDGTTLRNTATMSAGNADSVSDTAAFKLAIPTKLAAHATKSATPSQTIPALAGRTATFTIGGENDSNVSVDSLELTDPVDTAHSSFDYLAVTGLSDLELPDGATKVQLDWYDGIDWHAGIAGSPPSDPDALLPTDRASINGLRITFTGLAGKAIVSGATAKLTIETVSRDAFDALSADESLDVSNTVRAIVSRDAGNATDQASASVTFQKQPVQVAVTKSYATDQLVSGKTTTATVTATNGVMPVSRFELSEPASGDDDLAAQGLAFGGFVTDPQAPRQLAWPSGAMHAEITYRYTDGGPQSLGTDTADSLPEPDPARTVTGFTIVFTAPGDGIDSRAKATVPFLVTAGPVAQEAGVTADNTVHAEVTSSTPDTGAGTATAELTLLPQRVRTSTTKTFTRDTIWATPGTTNTVSITGRVSQSSTIGAEYLQVNDIDAGFWDYFDLRRIHSTDIPANANLTVSSFDGTAWQVLTGPVAGPVSDWSFTPSDTQRASIAGLRFTFTPKTVGTLLPVGFTVAPRFDVTLRRTLRSDPAIATTGGATPTVISDTAATEVGNTVAIQPVVSATTTAVSTLRPTAGAGGDGTLWLVTKRWIDPIGGDHVDATNISALTDGTRTAVLGWGTDGLSLSRLQVVDDPGYASPATSFYDAFDLVGIRPITGATDPQIGQDRVSAVELYSSAANDWVDVTSQACGSGAACDGGFPGYTLTDAQRATTLAVRLTFAPGSASQTGAVALSSSANRQIRFDYQLRRTLRSDPARYVLGDTHSYSYNSGHAGTVNNRVRATGILTEPDEQGNTTVTTSDTADISILDQPLNVSLTKTLDQTQLGLPQLDTTTAADYPLVRSTLVATNNTASHVPELTIADPSPATTGLGAYDRLNLYQIQFATLPDDLTASDVTVSLAMADGSTQEHSYAEAVGLTSAQLTDVVGVTVRFGAQANLADPSRALIASGASATVVLTYQLRSHLRSDPATLVADRDVVTNTARVELHSPGGISCTGGEGCDKPTADDSGSLTIVQPTYTVSVDKSLNWTSRYEDQSASGYVVTLTAQPDGTARTKLLTVTDAAPTFWNAFDLTGLPSVTLPAPITELRLSVLTGVTYDASGGQLTALCSGNTDLTACWHAGDWTTAAGDGQVHLVLPTGTSLAQVRGVQVEAQHSENGQVLQWERPANPTLVLRLNATRRATLVYGIGGATDTPVPTTRTGQPNAPGETAPGVFSDTATATGVAGWMNNTAPYTDTATDSASTTLKHRVNMVSVEKTPGQGAGSQAPRYDLDATIPYQLKVTNTGTWAMTGLQLADHIDLVGGSSPLVAADIAAPFTVKVNGVAATGFTLALDANTGNLRIDVPAGFTLAPSAVLLITTNLRFRDRLDRGTIVTNSVRVTSDRPFEKCDYTTDAKAQTALADVAECAASTTIVTAASTPMTVGKSVKGDAAGVTGASPGDPNYDDLGVIAVGAADATACQQPNADGFYSYPCTPITRPGGTETWQLALANNGNVAANVISGIDVLPAPGDTGVTVGSARKSKFAPIFLGNVQLDLTASAAAHHLRTFYTTTVLGASCNKADILNDTKPTGQDNCGIDWREFTAATDASTLATAKAVKFLLTFDDPADGLAPGEKLSLRFDTRTPASASVADPTTTDPIAWNSAAIGSRTADSETYPARASLVTEPRKAGIALASGQLDLTKIVAAPAGAAWLNLLPTSYEATLACTSGGEKVDLRGSTSSVDASVVRLAADGTPLAYNGTAAVNLPLGAECAITETTVPGSEVTYSAPSAVADRTYAGVPNVAHPYSGGQPGTLSVTNTYRNAGFTVTKNVTGPTARDAAGQPVHFNDYSFTATCTFAGSEVIPNEERAFSMRAGVAQEFSDLPAGASCSVAETYSAGAGKTRLVVTQGADSSPATGPTAGFDLVAGDASGTAIDVTNTYTTGAVTITKAFAGAGAALWADQAFEADLTCTSPDADPAIVYTARHSLTRADSTWTVTDLATGADCTVTETRSGGANASGVTGGTFTVGSDPAKPAQVKITNSFASGSVQVSKRVLANGQDTASGPWADGSYPVTLACTRQVDGTSTPVAIPGGATRQLTAAGHWAVTFDELPAGATCAASEGTVALSPAQPDPVVTITDPVTVGDATTSQLTVSNDFPAGRLVITKALAGAGTSFFTAASFDVSCKLTGYPTAVFTRTGVQVTAAALTSAPLGPIPFGAECTIHETDSGGADATPGDQIVTISPNPATADVTTVAFTNSFSAGKVSITKTLSGPAAAEAWATAPTFAIAVKCGLAAAGPYSYNATVNLKGGQSADLTDAGGNAKLFPVGTRCWATETSTAGAVTSVVDHDTFANGAVVQAAPGSVQSLSITATNTYTYAGFTVTKTVITSGATDQDGNTLVYSPTFTFTATCLFNGNEVTKVADRTFTLTKQGDGSWSTKAFDHLPTGATCTITETGKAGATTTQVQVTQNAVAGPKTTASSTTFTLAEGDATTTTAAFTNTYGIGTLRVTKVLSPVAPTWATASFTLHVSCTAAGFITGTVYSKDFTVAKGSLTIPDITNLPAGASCTTTEAVAANGGANATGITNGTVAIANGSIVTATVTNTFRTGSVKVTKALQVNGVATTAQPWVGGSYTMTLHCTRTVNGSPETLDLTKLAVSPTQVLNGANSFTYTWAGLPQAATCWATEDAIGYPAGTPSQPQPTSTTLDVPTVAVGNGTTVAQKVTNNFAYGGIQIVKQLTGEAAATFASGTFSFDTSCTLTGSGTVFTKIGTTLKRAASETTLTSAVIGPIPQGAICTVTETATAGATSVTPASRSVVLDAVAAGSNQTASFSNDFRYGGFTVTKTVDDGGAVDASGVAVPYAGGYAFSASCLFNGAEVVPLADRSFSLTRQGDGTWSSKAFSQLPSGASCTVTETGTAAAPRTSVTVVQGASTLLNTDATSTGAFSLATGDATATAVGFTNHYTTGGLDITKQLAGPGAAAWGTGTFTVALACTLDNDANAGTAAISVFSATHLLTDGQTWSVRNLPSGATCAVSEPKRAGANATAFANGTPTVTAANQAVTVTNTFNTGSVRVTKVLKVNGVVTTAQPWAGGSYTMQLSCVKDFDNDGTAEGLVLTGSTRTISGGGSATWTGLPEGATCAVAETGIAYPDGTPSQPVPSSTTYSATVSVANAGTADLTVTNDFAYGNVRISKGLTGPAAATYGSAAFSFDIACSLDGATGTVFARSGITLQRSGSETTLDSGDIGPIPQGAVCAVTETGTGGATAVLPASQIVVLDPVVAGAARTAGFANDFQFAGFTVTKTVDNGGAVDASGLAVPYAGTYSFTTSCIFNGAEVVAPANRTFTLTGGGSKLFTGLPTGASCTIVETGKAGSPRTSVTVTQGASTLVNTDATTSGAFVLVTGDASATAVGFTNHYTTGGLDITKQVAGAGAALWGGGTFTVGLVCTLDNDANAGTAAITVFNTTHTLTKTQTWAVRNLPSGSACTVSEPKKAGANTSAISLTTPTITAANQAVTVTNTFTVGSVTVTKALKVNGAATSAQPWTGGSYPVTIVCTKDFDNDGTAEALTITGATHTIVGAGSYTWSSLPQGASCTVTEGTSVVIGQPQPTPSVSANVTVAGTTQNLTLTNNFTAGKLLVHKDITGDGAVWGTGPFVYSVGCTLAGVGTVFSTTVTLTPTLGQTSLDSAALGPIPVASVCTVTETAAAGATTVTSPDPVTIALNAATADVTTVAFTNEFRNAGFTVTKSVQTGGALDAAGAAIAYRSAGFAASCTFKGVEVVPLGDRSFTLAAGASKQFAGLPTGATCKVTETDTAGAASTATAITQGGSPVTDTDAGALVAGFTLVSGNATATVVGFTNSYTTGSVLVTKALAGSGAALWADPQFTVRLVCTLASATSTTVFDGTHQLTVAAPWQVTDLPTGASCTVTEPAAGAANATSFTNATFTVGTTQAAVTVRNTYTVGAVRVTKHLTVDGAPTAATPWTAGSYTVALSCTRLVNGVATPIAIPSGATRTITGAGTADFTDLATGATCALAETGSSPVAQQTTISPNTVVIGADPATPQAFSVTNDFHTAALTIRKQLAGAGADSFGDGPFRFDTTCTLAGAGQVFHTTTTLNRAAGSTVATLTSDPLGPVPVGAVCVITETASAGADLVPDPVTLTISEDDAANRATFTNQFSAGTVWLIKQLGGAAAAEPWVTGASFVIDVTCQVKIDGVTGTVFSRRVTLAGGQQVNVTDAAGHPSRVPLGSHCFATEVDAQGAGSTDPGLDSYDNAAVVLAGSPAALQWLQLGVTNNYEYAGFTVTKSVSNGGALDADGQPVGYHAAYAFQADCTLNGLSVLSQAFELADGGSRAFSRLPAGASCTVGETAAGAAPHTSVQVTQNGSAGTAASASTASFTLQRGWVPFLEDSPTVNQVAFANTYDTGAITVTKQVVGDGADDWGNAQFRVQLSCTLDTDADAATPAALVYDLTRTMTKADPSWTVTNLPSGAHCTATETADGGANSHTAPQDVVVGNQPASPTQVRLTNFFGTGAVLVTKTMTVDGATPTPGGWADQLASGHISVRLDCTRLVNGIAEVVPVPGAAERTIDATSGWQASYTGLPVGADCTATEVSSTPAAQSVSYSLPTVTVTATHPAEIGITNDYRTGSLVVAKQVTGAGAAFGDGPFHFAVRCTLAGLADPVYVHELSLGAGSLTSAPLGPIPVGAHCRVTETAAGGATTPADPADVTIPDDVAVANTATATLVNDFAVGGFTVTKTVDDGGALDANGNPVAYPGRYRFAVACDFDGTALSLPTQDASFALTAGEHHPITGLPQGASCSITETSSGNAALVTVQLDGRPAVAATTAGLTIGQTPVTLAVTNHYRVGAATVTKLVTGSGAAAWGNGPFTLHTTCTLDTDADDATAPVTVFTADHQVTRTEPDWTITNLPSGADCTVTETTTGGANTPAGPATFSVGQDPAHPVPVTLVNDFSTGSVRISKAILVDGKPSTADPYSSATYQLKLTCTRNVDGNTIAIDIPGDAAPAGDAADGVRTVTGAGSVTFTDLPTGASCAATEVAAGLALPADQVSVDQTLVSVPASDRVDVTVTNDYHTGMLVVGKALAGAGAATYADGEFTFDVACTLADTSGVDHAVFSATGLVLSRAAGLASDPLGPIPVGSSCTVTETAAGGADQPAAPVTVSIADRADNVATLTNTFTEGSLRLRLSLTLDGATTTADPYVSGRYTTEITCTREVNGATVAVPVPGGASWTSMGPGERLVTGLPVGASCSVTQTAASLTPQGVSYEPMTGAGAAASSAVVVTADVDRPATLMVIDDFTTSTLSVRKVLAGAGAGVHGDQEFRFTVDCTLAEDGAATPHDVFSTTVTLTRAARLDSDPLGPVPVGSRCTVTETAAGGATVPSDPVTISVGANAGANVATLTNTFDVGSVTVTKSLQVDGAPTTAEPYVSGTYTVRLDCTRLVDGGQVPVTIPGGSTRTITGAGSVDFTGLPLGASCQVSEPSASLAIPAAQVTISPMTLTVGGEPVSAEVTNDYRSGSLVLHWNLTGTGVVFAGPANFTVECTLAGATAPVFQQDLTLVPIDGQGYVESGVLGPIPVGSICTVTQHTADGANTLAIPVSVTGTTTVMTAQLANQYSAGTLTVVKRLTGTGAGEHGDTSFTIAVTCAQSGDGTPLYTGDVTITGAGSTGLVDGAGQPLLLPAGTRCWAAETGTGGALESTVDHGSFAQAVAVTADNPDIVQQLTITVTNRFGASTEALAFTGGAGWGLGLAGMASIVVGAWLVSRRRLQH